MGVVVVCVWGYLCGWGVGAGGRRCVRGVGCGGGGAVVHVAEQDGRQKDQ